MKVNLRMVGLVRFSVLSPTYYSERFASVEETAEHLFAPERMDLRFRLFEHLCLRSLARQSDKRFRLVVLTAEALPVPYMERLQALIATLPNASLRAVPPAAHHRQLKEAYDSVPLRRATHRILFRLDDDDAVDRDFVKRTKALARGLIPVQKAETPFIIAHNRGFYLERGLDGASLTDTCERAPLSAGAALVAPAGHGGTPYAVNHRRFAQHYNTFSDISVPAFLRTIHGDNKSKPAKKGITGAWSTARRASALRRHFGFDLAELEGLLA
ncbi:glycosyltransferase [Cribrihabitans neustonicus]|uniref:glycosyltransferase n=1 Tax=Cribrihabitans neustonicus TaxID=1429085 RepID=UPI003B5CEC4B